MKKGKPLRKVMDDLQKAEPEPMGEIHLSFVGSKASLTSRLIELFSAGPVSHVDAIEPTTGLLWGARFDKVGGKPSGFYGRPASYIEKETTRVIVAIPCRRTQQDGFWAAAHASEGEPYDWEGIVSFGLGGSWHKRGTAFCSEKMRELLVGQAILPARPFDQGYKTTPKDLLDEVAARNDTKILYTKGLP